MKRIMGLFLSLILVFSFSLTALASASANTFEVDGVSITSEKTEDGYTVTRANHKDYYEIVVRKSGSFVMEWEKYDYNDNLIDKKIYDFTPEKNSDIEPYVIGDYQHTICNYEYDIVGGAGNRYEIWQLLRREDSKTRAIHETENNPTYEWCLTWKTHVDDINDTEKELVELAGEDAIFGLVSAYFGMGWVGAYNVLTDIPDALILFEDLVDQMDDADYVWLQI